MDKTFKQIYYFDDGYWRGKSAIQKLSRTSGSTKEEAEKWLMKQQLYQIYLPPPKYIPMRVCHYLLGLTDPSPLSNIISLHAIGPSIET